MSRAKNIPPPAPERGGEPPDVRRAFQRSRGEDRQGDGLSRDRAGRDTVRTADGSPLSVNGRGLDLQTSDAFETVDGKLRFRKVARWRPNPTSPISGSGADAAINTRLDEIEARIDTLVQLARAQGGLG